MDYSDRCLLAYELAVDSGIPNTNLSWSEMTTQQRVEFTLSMAVYDMDMYNDLLIESISILGAWGSKKLASFLFDLRTVLI